MMRILSLVPRLPRVGLVCLAAVVLFSACGGEADPATETIATTTSPEPTTTVPPPTTTTLPSPTTTVPPTTAPEASEEIADVEIGPGTVWRDVFEVLPDAEQSCIRDAVGANLDRVLSREILDEDEAGQQELALLPCLPPRILRTIFLTGMMLGMEDDGVVVAEEQEACLQEVVDEIDVAALISVLAAEAGGSDDAAEAEGAAQLLEMMAGLLRCLPELWDTGVEEPDDHDIVDDYADGLAGAAPVELGEIVEGALDYQGDWDYFAFEAVGGELYEIEVDLGTLPDSVVTVYDANGYPLDYNDDQQDSLAARLFWRAPDTGTFYIEVAGYSEGSYTLTVVASDVVDDYADGPVGAARVELGEIVEGALDYQGDADYFGFEAMEGKLYEIEADLGTLADSKVTVYDADGYPLDYNDDQQDSLAARLFWRAPDTGTFYIEVSGYGEGSYTLTVEETDFVDDYADGLVGAARMELEEIVEGALDYPGDWDYFAFEAMEGKLYEIEADLGTLPHSVVTVLDADGYPLGSNDDQQDSSASRLFWRAPDTGTFYVEVAGYSEGSYTLTVVASDVVDDYPDGLVGAAPVELGEIVEGALDYQGDADYFAFEAMEGKLYEIEVDLGTLADSKVTVYDAGGAWLGSNDDQQDSLASRLFWRAPDTGAFYVEVSGYGEGSYTLTVEETDIVDDYADGLVGAARVELSEVVEGALDYPGDWDYFAFEAMEGELYEIEVDLGTLPHSVVTVLDANGYLLGSNDDQQGSLESRLFWRAPDTGTFYVEVAGYSEGSYTLTVGVSDSADDHSDHADGATAVGVGESVGGMLEYPDDVDVFALEAVEGQLYEIEVTLGTLSDSIVAVYDPDGVELAWNDDQQDSLASRLEWSPPADGDYYVEVSGYGEGSYTLAVELAE